MKIAIAWADGADQSLGLPAYETAGAAGADVRANFADRSTVIRPRSGLALKHGISMVNAPGTIDSDYRGPVGVILINHGDAPFDVTHGMRIAQMVAAPVTQAEFAMVDTLDETARGAAGFGSTGQ